MKPKHQTNKLIAWLDRIGENMKKYETKKVEIEAIEWKGRSVGDAGRFCVENGLPGWHIGNDRDGNSGLKIPTLEGDMIASRGDFVIKGLRGEYYPCKPDVFHMKYVEI